MKPLRNHADAIRRRLTVGIARPAELCAFADISQPTFWRTLQTLRDEILAFGATRAICYALRDRARTADIPVYRVDEAGNTHHVGVLIAVKPEGFLLQETGGKSQHSDGLPWWLDDMRPQGYLGRVWAQQHAHALALSPHLSDWQHEPACILRALLQEGDDLPGNLLLGDAMRARFHNTPVSPALSLTARRQHYVQLAQQIASGNIPASSVAGEQPKFTTYAMTAQGARHLIVKFSELPENEVTERWRDLLLAEYHALQTLGAAGIAAAETSILDHGGQRFLEIVRFDRVNAKGRLALHSLTALDAEYIGKAPAGWPTITRLLAADRHITRAAADGAALLWAYSELIGNNDRHNGNLSFIGEHRPYDLAPAYDISPMCFAPRSSGGMNNDLPAATIHPEIAPRIWRRALPLAQTFLQRLQRENRFSPRFEPCIAALAQHIAAAQETITRL